MEEGGRTQFVVEVDELAHRIETLRESITVLGAGLAGRVAAAAHCSQAAAATQAVVQEAQNGLELDNTQPSPEQLELLWARLNSLGSCDLPTTTSPSTALVPVSSPAPGLVSLLSTWQTVFEDTLGRYQRVSAQLTQQSAVGVAAAVWADQLDQVEARLATPPATSPAQLGEQLRLAGLYRSLLSQNHSLMLRSSPALDQVKLRSNSI